jgi:hypothetical protein
MLQDIIKNQTKNKRRALNIQKKKAGLEIPKGRPPKNRTRTNDGLVPIILHQPVEDSRPTVSGRANIRPTISGKTATEIAANLIAHFAREDNSIDTPYISYSNTSGVVDALSKKPPIKAKKATSSAPKVVRFGEPTILGFD